MLLEVEGIHTFYGLSHILFGISFNVSEGEIVCILGRNGAGKSTTMRSIMSLTPPKKGEIRYKGKLISGKKPYQLARQGIGYVPDNRRVFADLTVDENLQISERNITENATWNRVSIYDFFPPLKHIKSRKAGFLSGGEQQMLTIARALMVNPDLLLLDEPTEGLAPMIVEMLVEQISTLREKGLTVLLAEQNVKVALRLSSRGYIIDKGVIRYQGSVEDLKKNEDVMKRYLLV
ncbi:MAG TPA: ABC transporter ATP-binding protein [Desulfobacteraceae bacterium]|mgnify:CR=1 FL=1|nr:ABC transporter ATP-binding protein [Desulfobacteraceae bacterium]HPQ29622.1 ABC transporter ATP-binding protein [Desulfobacteraceae bacterium]